MEGGSPPDISKDRSRNSGYRGRRHSSPSSDLSNDSTKCGPSRDYNAGNRDHSPRCNEKPESESRKSHKRSHRSPRRHREKHHKSSSRKHMKSSRHKSAGDDDSDYNCTASSNSRGDTSPRFNEKHDSNSRKSHKRSHRSSHRSHDKHRSSSPPRKQVAQRKSSSSEDSDDNNTAPPFSNRAVPSAGAKLMAEIERRKQLLNFGKKSNEADSSSSAFKVATLSGGAMDVDKYNRLMGRKNDDASSSNAQSNYKPSQPAKPNTNYFHQLETEYEKARATTHTQRGVGLGFFSK